MVRDIRERKGFSTDAADVENEANVSAKYAESEILKREQCNRPDF